MNKVKNSIISLFTALSVTACASSNAPLERDEENDVQNNNSAPSHIINRGLYAETAPDNMFGEISPHPYHRDIEDGVKPDYLNSLPEYSDASASCDSGFVDGLVMNDAYSRMMSDVNSDGIESQAIEDRIKSHMEERRALLDMLFGSCDTDNDELRHLARGLGDNSSALMQSNMGILGSIFGVLKERDQDHDPDAFKALVVEAFILHGAKIREYYPVDDMLEQAAIFQEQYIRDRPKFVKDAGFYFNKDNLTDAVHEAVENHYDQLVTKSLADNLRSIFDIPSNRDGYFPTLRSIVEGAVLDHMMELRLKNEANPSLSV